MRVRTSRSSAARADTSDLLRALRAPVRKLSLERAIHRITAEPAAAWGIKNRGPDRGWRRRRPYALRSDTIERGAEESSATFRAAGIATFVMRAESTRLIVNGEVVVDAGNYTASRTGQIV